MDYGETEGNFNIVIVNDDLEKAYQSLRGFILPEIEKNQKKDWTNTQEPQEKRSKDQMPKYITYI